MPSLRRTRVGLVDGDRDELPGYQVVIPELVSSRLQVTFPDTGKHVAYLVRALGLTVVPVTSDTDRVFPFQALLPADSTGLPQDSKAQAEQVRSIAVERMGMVPGRVPAGVMAQLDDALRLHLQL